MRKCVLATVVAAVASFTTFDGRSARADLICPVERAAYAMGTEDGDFSLSFIPARSYASMASDLYLCLGTPQRSYWFVLTMSNGYGGMTMLPVSDPYQESAKQDGPRHLLEVDGVDAQIHAQTLTNLRFYLLDEKFDFISEPPASGEPAPAFIMMPELGATLWYDPAAVSEDPAAKRDPMPRGVFRFMSCLGDTPPKAWP